MPHSEYLICLQIWMLGVIMANDTKGQLLCFLYMVIFAALVIKEML